MNKAVRITRAPFLRNSGTVQSLMGDMLIVMPFLYAMPIFFYGFRVVINLIISLVFCYGLDTLCVLIRDKRVTSFDASSLVTGAIIPLLMPASIDAGIVIAAAFFAIVVVKHPFGGLGNNPFNPAAAAYCFCALAWPLKMTAYTKPTQWLPLFSQIDETYAIKETMAQNLKNAGRPHTDFFDIISGNLPGAAGTTAVIVVLAVAGYLLYRKTISAQIPLGIIFSSSIFALIFPRISTGRLDSVWFELTSGTLLFCAVLLATEPVTSPKHPYAKWIYGAAIGIITMLFRHFGKVENAIPFAIIIANSITPLLDKIGTGIDKYTDISIKLPSFEFLKKFRKGGEVNER